MLTLTTESIKDYQVCSFFFNEKYILESNDASYAREQLAEKFEMTLRRIVSFFFYKRQGGIVPSYNALLNRWEKLWFPKNVTAYDISTERHESAHGNLASYSNAAAAALLKFYEDFINYKADPIIIDEKFLMPIGKELRLEGKFDLVLKNQNGFQVIKWSTKTKRPPLDSFTYDFAGLKLAYDYRNKSDRTPEYLMYDLGSTNPGGTVMTPTTADVKGLIYWANKAKDSYDNELYVPRRGFTTYCRNCAFDKPCRKFSFGEATA